MAVKFAKAFGAEVTLFTTSPNKAADAARLGADDVVVSTDRAQVKAASRRFDFVKEAAARLTNFLRPKDSVIVAPFAKRLSALTGPTGDRRTIIEAIQHIEPTGGTAILDSLVELSER